MATREPKKRRPRRRRQSRGIRPHVLCRQVPPHHGRAVSAFIVSLQETTKGQAQERLATGEAWHDNNLVFCREEGSMYTSDALNWRFSKMTRRAGIGHWHAHEGRHTAVSIMSSNGVPIQDISDTVGHKSTHVTETVYRHVIAPAIRGGATVMDDVFGEDDGTDGDDNKEAKSA